MITASAVCRGDMIVTGQRHYHCIKSAVETYHWSTPVTQAEQGFVTDEGKFLDRVKARDHAIACGQVAADFKGRILFSEDLW